MKKEFRHLEEQINTIINTNALIQLLANKGIIKDYEFRGMKSIALENFKREYPDLFKD